ncbi:integral membrane [Lecanosticta acicola]|uniref:Efficient mitochondria targeting-associated protein 19 n=1 Tax=Lecanosticta acicola TaxID=111012 RepID=A0AAI8Z6N8_9PEZI|nr:integral membrane [Lecanosticta acicola]
MSTLLSRKKDLIYLIFFAIHIPVMFFVDLAPLYPSSLKPTPITLLRNWYIQTYRDKFFIAPPAWFTMYIWMELIYHVPLSLWAVGALLRDDSMVPVHLLVYAVQTAITTATCIADYLSWEGYSNAEKVELGKLYVPYLALSVFMGVDMYTRLHFTLSRRRAGSNVAKKRN